MEDTVKKVKKIRRLLEKKMKRWNKLKQEIKRLEDQIKAHSEMEARPMLVVSIPLDKIVLQKVLLDKSTQTDLSFLKGLMIESAECDSSTKSGQNLKEADSSNN